MFNKDFLIGLALLAKQKTTDSVSRVAGDEVGEVAGWVIVTALVVVAAIVIVGIVVKYLTSTANSITQNGTITPSTVYTP